MRSARAPLKDGGSLCIEVDEALDRGWIQGNGAPRGPRKGDLKEPVPGKGFDYASCSLRLDPRYGSSGQPCWSG